MNTIDIERLRQIIKEEASSLNEASKSKERSVHAAHAAVVSRAADLLDAIAEFKQDATIASVNAITPIMSQLEAVLTKMTTHPGSYVDQVKKEPKKVSLKAVKSG